MIDSRYAPDERPEKPESTDFTHRYRIEQFRDMLGEAGAWESAS